MAAGHGARDTVRQVASDEVLKSKESEGRSAVPKPQHVISEQSLIEVWGHKGSWTMYAVQPNRKETPLQQRVHKVWPIRAIDDASMPMLAAIATKGCKGAGDTSIGQDNFSVSLLPNGWEVLCIMDGHGAAGHWPATRSVRTMPYFLQQEACSKLLDQENPVAALKQVFALVESELELAARTDNIDLAMSGTTATCVLRNPHLYPERLWVATVGDSRCILFVTESSSNGRPVGVVAETVDHRPLLPEERRRLESSGCDVRSLEHANGFVEVRVFVAGEEYPGLCMSRSLGDVLMKERGVTAEPEVVEWIIPSHSPAYVLGASDGVWEFLETPEAVNIVRQDLLEQPDPLAACRRLLRKSQELWHANEGNYCDDITLVLCAVGGANAMPLVPCKVKEVLDASNVGACGEHCVAKCAVQ